MGIRKGHNLPKENSSRNQKPALKDDLTNEHVGFLMPFLWPAYTRSSVVSCWFYQIVLFPLLVAASPVHLYEKWLIHARTDPYSNSCSALLPQCSHTHEKKTSIFLSLSAALESPQAESTGLSLHLKGRNSKKIAYKAEAGFGTRSWR